MFVFGGCGAPAATTAVGGIAIILADSRLDKAALNNAFNLCGADSADTDTV